MLALDIGLPITYNVPITLLSALVAILSTFSAFSAEFLCACLRMYRGRRQRRRAVGKGRIGVNHAYERVLGGGRRSDGGGGVRKRVGAGEGGKDDGGGEGGERRWSMGSRTLSMRSSILSMDTDASLDMELELEGPLSPREEIDNFVKGEFESLLRRGEHGEGGYLEDVDKFSDGGGLEVDGVKGGRDGVNGHGSNGGGEKISLPVMDASLPVLSDVEEGHNDHPPSESEYDSSRLPRRTLSFANDEDDEPGSDIDDSHSRQNLLPPEPFTRQKSTPPALASSKNSPSTYSGEIRRHVRETKGIQRWTVMHFLRVVWISCDAKMGVKSFCLAFSVFGMHYTGMFAMRMDGVIIWDIWIVFLSFVIAWVVCCVALIFMPSQDDPPQQLLFSLVGALGVCGMHYTGIYAASFHTLLPPPYPPTSYPPYLPVSITAVAVLTCFSSYVMLAHALTESRERIRRVVKSKKRLWELLAEERARERGEGVKMEFISVASHEIRTPLHAISGYADLLLSTPLSPEQLSYVHAIRTGCHTAQLITNNVLDFAKLERMNEESWGKVEKLDVRKIVEGVVGSCGGRMVAEGFEVSGQEGEGGELDLIVDVEEGVPRFVGGDEVYVTRGFFRSHINELTDQTLSF
ncbi:hypothetical protein HDV00_001372 [Rhizophlyctis rosea]|nr:hypothetical protein HDV00_001372 [Rhizophlyctis rosea]